MRYGKWGDNLCPPPSVYFSRLCRSTVYSKLQADRRTTLLRPCLFLRGPGLLQSVSCRVGALLALGKLCVRRRYQWFWACVLWSRLFRGEGCLLYVHHTCVLPVVDFCRSPHALMTSAVKEETLTEWS